MKFFSNLSLLFLKDLLKSSAGSLSILSDCAYKILVANMVFDDVAQGIRQLILPYIHIFTSNME